MGIIEMAREAGFSCLLPDEAMDMIGGVFEGDANLTKTLERFAALVSEATKEKAAKQAEIDRLMWEFCPQEMTLKQVANWEAHQQPWSDE